MQRFHLETKDKDILAEGVIFSNGSVALSWMTARPGGAFYADLFELERIHRDLKVVMSDKDADYEPLKRKTIFEIGCAENGWVVREYESDTVLVASEDHKSEHEAFVSLLWSLISQFGPSDSKYSPERIVVDVVPGADCEHASLCPKKVREKVLDHLDYCLRFLHNVDPNNNTPEIVALEKQIDRIFESLFSQVFTTIPT